MVNLIYLSQNNTKNWKSSDYATLSIFPTLDGQGIGFRLHQVLGLPFKMPNKSSIMHYLQESTACFCADCLFTKLPTLPSNYYALFGLFTLSTANGPPITAKCLRECTLKLLSTVIYHSTTYITRARWKGWPSSTASTFHTWGPLLIQTKYLVKIYVRTLVVYQKNCLPQY